MRATKAQLEAQVAFLNSKHGMEDGVSLQFFVLEFYNGCQRLCFNIDSNGCSSNVTLLMTKRELGLVLDGMIQALAFAKIYPLVKQ